MMTYLVVDALDLSADKRVQLLANEKFGFLCLTVDSPFAPKWRLDTAALKRLTKSKGWKTFKMDREAIESIDALIALVAERRHNVAITWSSEQDCFNDVHETMGVHTSDAVARVVVPALAVATAGTVDPEKRIVVRVALPPGYLGLSALGRREANQRASKKYLAGRVDITIDDALTIVGYAIEAPHAPTSRGDGISRTAA
jgi:hypothetical protein